MKPPSSRPPVSVLALALAAALALAMVLPLRAGADWNQWRGPLRTGASPDHGPLADQWPENGPVLLWESGFIPSDHDGGHGSPVVAGGRVYLGLVWHERVPSEKRVLDSEVLSALQVARPRFDDEIIESLERARTEQAPRLRGDRLEAFIEEWMEEHLTEEQRLQWNWWIVPRIRAGRSALSLEVIASLNSKRDHAFGSVDDLRAWMTEEGFDDEVQNRVLQAVPATIKLAEDTILCLSLEDGSELWRYSDDGEVTSRQASSTPAVIDGRVYWSGSNGLICVDAGSGEHHWTAAFAASGPAASPLVTDDAVIVLAGRLHAFDRQTGEPLWEQNDIRGSATSPVLWHDGGQTVILCVSGRHVNAVDPASGEILWRVPGGNNSTPAVGPEHFAVLGEGDGFALRTYRAADNGGEPELAWEQDWLTRRYQSTPLIHNGHVWLLGSGRHLCAEVDSGSVRWQETRESTISSPALVDDKLFVLENNGTHLLMLAADANEYRQLGRARVDAMWCPSPAISDGRLILRRRDKLVCFDLR